MSYDYMLPRQDANDFFMEVAKGTVNNMSALRMFGSRVVAGAATDVWKVVAAVDGEPVAKTLPSVAKLLSISSSDVLDITQYVTVNGLDANYQPISVTKKLAGRTETALSTTVYFLRVTSVTLDAACLGNVFVYDAASAVTNGVPNSKNKILATITIADLESYDCYACTPYNKKGWVYNIKWHSNSAAVAKEVLLTLVVKTDAGVTTTYNIASYTDPGSGQLQLAYKPIEVAPKSDIKLMASLVGGSALALETEVNIVLEDVTAAGDIVTVLTKSQFDAQLAPHTLASTKLYLIGLAEVPSVFPTTVDLNDTLAIITGEAIAVGHNGYHVAATTEVAFNMDVFRTGILVQTTQKAIACVWRCVDSNGDVLYNAGLTPQIITLGGKTLKTIFSEI